MPKFTIESNGESIDDMRILVDDKPIEAIQRIEFMATHRAPAPIAAVYIFSLEDNQADIEKLKSIGWLQVHAIDVNAVLESVAGEENAPQLNVDRAQLAGFGSRPQPFPSSLEDLDYIYAPPKSP